MIEELRIRDLGVIADTTLMLGPGFTAITGETGAGKTMVVSALGLLMGERSDAGAVRAGASQARVNGIVQTVSDAVREEVEDLGGEIEDGELVLGRTVSAEGRSRASIGGASAPVGALGRLAEHLFAVHGQSEQLRLKSAAAQRETLDRFGGASPLLAEYRAVHRERQALEASVVELRAALGERAAEAERLRAELEEIERVDPQVGEEAELQRRVELLGNIEALRAATSTAHEALASESDDPFVRDATGLVAQALHEVEGFEAADDRLAAVAEALRGAGVQLAEAVRYLGSYASDLDGDATAELARANERLSQLHALFRQYGDDAASVIDFAAAGAVRLTELDGDTERVDDLEAVLAAAAERERALAATLTERRTEAAARLGKLVTAELAFLALPDARFVAEVTPLDALGSAGGDEVAFKLAAHPGSPPRSLAKSASGGELSRVMLAIEVVLAGADPVPTFVFDEVDAGVGGAAAIEIGRRLAMLARTSQVIVVTHLAQVAAFANNHIRISKDTSGGFTESSCRVLEGDERLAEMARLLSGLSDSGSALEHAAELLALGRGERD